MHRVLATSKKLPRFDFDTTSNSPASPGVLLYAEAVVTYLKTELHVPQNLRSKKERRKSSVKCPWNMQYVVLSRAWDLSARPEKQLGKVLLGLALPRALFAAEGLLSVQKVTSSRGVHLFMPSCSPAQARSPATMLCSRQWLWPSGSLSGGRQADLGIKSALLRLETAFWTNMLKHGGWGATETHHPTAPSFGSSDPCWFTQGQTLK